MSIRESLIQYLTEYEKIELRPIGELLPEIAASTSPQVLMPVGEGTIVMDVTGKRTYVNNYQFFARRRALEEGGSQDDLLDGFFEWLEERVDAGDLPVFPGRYQAENLEAANVMLFEIDGSGEETYRIQIKLTFIK